GGARGGGVAALPAMGGAVLTRNLFESEGGTRRVTGRHRFTRLQSDGASARDTSAARGGASNRVAPVDGTRVDVGVGHVEKDGFRAFAVERDASAFGRPAVAAVATVRAVVV